MRRKPSPFRDTSPLSFVLSVAVPLALYLTWWYAPALSVTSDATLLFVGASMLLAALRASTGCEALALSNWLLHRSDQIACGVFTPIDELEQRLRRRRMHKAAARPLRDSFRCADCFALARSLTSLAAPLASPQRSKRTSRRFQQR